MVMALGLELARAMAGHWTSISMPLVIAMAVAMACPWLVAKAFGLAIAQ